MWVQKIDILSRFLEIRAGTVTKTVRSVYTVKVLRHDHIRNLLCSGKPQNQNEAERLRQSIPSGTGRIFKDRRGALLLVNHTVIDPFRPNILDTIPHAY